MARAEDENSANSQFFIMLAPSFNLDHKYTGLGRVVSGMQFVDGIAPGEPPSQPTKIVRAWLDGPVAVAVVAAPAQPSATAVAPVPEAAPPQVEVGPAPAEQPAAAAPASAAEQPVAEVPAAPAEEPTADESTAEVPAKEAEQPKDEPQESPTGG